MQNRDMANSLGVRTRNIDRLTFALGSGIAGVAGYGWTIIGGVTPDMGQTNFIVDSFLTEGYRRSRRIGRSNLFGVRHRCCHQIN